jgi:hypothetical protein
MREHRFELDRRFVEPALLGEQHAEVVMRLERRRPEAERVAILPGASSKSPRAVARIARLYVPPACRQAELPAPPLVRRARERGGDVGRQLRGVDVAQRERRVLAYRAYGIGRAGFERVASSVVRCGTLAQRPRARAADERVVVAERLRERGAHAAGGRKAREEARRRRTMDRVARGRRELDQRRHARRDRRRAPARCWPSSRAGARRASRPDTTSSSAPRPMRRRDRRGSDCTRSERGLERRLGIGPQERVIVARVALHVDGDRHVAAAAVGARAADRMMRVRRAVVRRLVTREAERVASAFVPSPCGSWQFQQRTPSWNILLCWKETSS